jgi:hypothetical protein
LRYAHTTLNNKWLRAVVYEDYMDLAAIIGVDGSGRIEHGDAMTDGQPRARAHLTFRTCRQSHANSGWNERPVAGRNRQRGSSGNRRQEIESGGVLALIGRQRQVRRVWEPHNLDVNFFHT